MFPRQLKFHCRFCVQTFEVTVAWGCFVKIEKGQDENTNSIVEVYSERMGRTDAFLYELVCPICGCCSGLKEIKDSPKTDKGSCGCKPEQCRHNIAITPPNKEDGPIAGKAESILNDEFIKQN